MFHVERRKWARKGNTGPFGRPLRQSSRVARTVRSARDARRCSTWNVPQPLLIIACPRPTSSCVEPNGVDRRRTSRASALSDARPLKLHRSDAKSRPRSSWGTSSPTLRLRIETRPPHPRRLSLRPQESVVLHTVCGHLSMQLSSQRLQAASARTAPEASPDPRRFSLRLWRTGERPGLGASARPRARQRRGHHR